MQLRVRSACAHDHARDARKGEWSETVVPKVTDWTDNNIGDEMHKYAAHKSDNNYT